MKDKKNLLIYAHYYIPDTASTGQILRELAEGLLEAFNVTVICVVPSYLGAVAPEYKIKKFYHEAINGVNVIRVNVPEFSKDNKLSRIKNILAYFFRARKVTKRIKDIDYILSVSQPPILGGLLGVYGKKKTHAKLIYQIQDFNPEQIMAVKYSHNKFILNLMKRLDKLSCQKSDLVVTVGRDLVETLKSRFSKDPEKMPKVVMINNWIDERKIYPLENYDEGVLEFKKEYSLTNKFVIMYSGNLGLYYDLENIFKVLLEFGPGTKTIDGRDVVFAFVGAGSVLNKLKYYKEAHNMSNVVFIPYQDKDKLIFSLNAADVHWCVNSKGIKGVSCPSKYYGLAACAKPILGVLEKGSEIYSLIEETKGGLLCEPGDYEGIKKNIDWFINHADDMALEDMGRRSYNNLISNLTKEKSINKYEEEILKL